MLTFRRIITLPLRPPLQVPKVFRYSTKSNLHLLKKEYETDEWTNLTPKIISKVGLNLHTAQRHPLSFIRQRIVNYFYRSFHGKGERPLFSVYDSLDPVVTTEQNFDSLLVPQDHPSRSKTDCYYVNKSTLLRAHTTAHQVELISSGLDNFLVVGDVYRRDEIDKTHYPVFHQLDAVRTFTSDDVFGAKNVHGLGIFEHRANDSMDKQGCHTLETVKIVEHDLKSCLVGLAQELFGKDVKYRWNDECFPFTHPSWELEVFHNDNWIEILGCGIMRQEILQRASARERVGWAFGLGLERLAMCMYDIPDIRSFWSQDLGFTSQFDTDDAYASIKFKPVSVHPPCSNDMSFWLPEDLPYSPNDFYDTVREIAGENVEQIQLIDQFTHPKTKTTSHCYRIVYRHMNRALTQNEVSQLHTRIKIAVEKKLKVKLR